MLIFCWYLSFADYNYYFDSWFIFDRIFLFFLGALSFFQPSFLILFLIQAITLSNQYAFPNCFNYTYTDKGIIFDFILIIWIFYMAKPILKRLEWNHLYIFFFSIIGIWYLKAGIGKHQIDWLTENNLYYLLSASTLFGWLSFVPNGFLITSSTFLKDHHLIINSLTFFVELIVPVTIFFNRRTAILGLSFYISFHLMVFLSSGIFFWKWVLLEITIISVLFFFKEQFRSFFGIKNTFIYLVVLISGFFFFESKFLVWLDSGYTKSYHFYLKDKNQKLTKLDASFFSPYDVIFAQNRFNYLDSLPNISYTYGATTNHELLYFVRNFNPVNYYDKDLNDFRKESGTIKYDEEKKKKLFNFLRQFTNTKLKNQKSTISILNSPFHIWQGPNQEVFEFENQSFHSIEIIVSENVSLNNLEFFTAYSDTISVKL